MKVRGSPGEFCKQLLETVCSWLTWSPRTICTVVHTSECIAMVFFAEKWNAKPLQLILIGWGFFSVSSKRDWQNEAIFLLSKSKWKSFIMCLASTLCCLSPSNPPQSPLLLELSNAHLHYAAWCRLTFPNIFVVHFASHVLWIHLSVLPRSRAVTGSKCARGRP